VGKVKNIIKDTKYKMPVTPTQFKNQKIEFKQ
jgi:hypothetical protein